MGGIGEQAGELGRDLHGSRPQRCRGPDPCPRLQAELPDRPRPPRRLRPQDRRDHDARGVRDRCRGQGPLPRADRRPVRRPPRAERDARRQRAEGRDRGGPRRQGGGRRRIVEAVGCPIPEAPAAAAHPTYTKDVAAILQKNCLECHRKGQVGPFALETYEQARKRAADIASVVEDRLDAAVEGLARTSGSSSRTSGPSPRRTSPPSSPGPKPGPRRATRATCRRPRSSPTTGSSARPTWSSTSAADFAVPASGDDIYRCFVVPTNLDKDQYVTAIEYRRRQSSGRPPHPGLRGRLGRGAEARRGRSRARVTRASRARASRSTATWAAGHPASSPARCPRASADRCPRGSDIIIQMHYHPSGKAETDRTRDRPALRPQADPADPALGRRRQPRDGAAAREDRTSRSRPPGRSPWTSSPTP